MDGKKVAKGLLGAFLMLVGLVAIIGALYLNQYVMSIILGSVFEVADIDTTDHAVTARAFTANGTTAQSLGHTHIIVGTLAIYNSSTNFEWALSNFTIDYGAGTVLNVGSPNLENGTALRANYTYQTFSSGLPVTNQTTNFLTSTETSFFNIMGNVNTGASFAAGLIAIGVILIVFGGLVTFGVKKYKQLKGKGGEGGSNLDY